MHRTTHKYFEDAAKIALSKFDRRAYLFGGVGIRNDGCKVYAMNSPTNYPDRRAHVEYKLSRKLDTDAVMYIARIKLVDGSFGMARPCHNCRKLLRSRKINQVFYTIDADYYGVWHSQTDTDKIYSNR